MFIMNVISTLGFIKILIEGNRFMFLHLWCSLRVIFILSTSQVSRKRTRRMVSPFVPNLRIMFISFIIIKIMLHGMPFTLNYGAHFMIRDCKGLSWRIAF